MDNNTAERILRNPAVGRKNYYGSGSVWSAHFAAMMTKLAGGPWFAIEAPCRHMGVKGGLEGRHQLLKLVEGQAGEIQKLRGASLQIGKSYTGHVWCLLSVEAQHTINRKP